ncbi:hypothetical protein ACETU7_13510 [Rhodococcus sp. 3Y1]
MPSRLVTSSASSALASSSVVVGKNSVEPSTASAERTRYLR